VEIFDCLRKESRIKRIKIDEKEEIYLDFESFFIYSGEKAD
jgi:hypothetical protein